MPQLILPNLPRLALPERVTLASHAAPVTLAYGVELEGIMPLAKVFSRDKDSVTADRNSQHWLLANRIMEDTPLHASAKKTLGMWWVKDDQTIVGTSLKNPLQACRVEFSSPILSGENGLKNIETLFDHLDDNDFYTNQSCGLHVHTSLNWRGRTEDSDALKEIRNVYLAFIKNLDFFKLLVAPHRYGDEYCRENEPAVYGDFPRHVRNIYDLITELNPKVLITDRLSPDPGYMLNLAAIIAHGTLEWRMKEAADYPNALGFIRFVVAFTFEAAQNPNVKAEEVVNKYFMMPPLTITSRPEVFHPEAKSPYEALEAR
jgi:hypothetical protein